MDSGADVRHRPLGLVEPERVKTQPFEDDLVLLRQDSSSFEYWGGGGGFGRARWSFYPLLLSSVQTASYKAASVWREVVSKRKRPFKMLLLVSIWSSRFGLKGSERRQRCCSRARP